LGDTVEVPDAGDVAPGDGDVAPGVVSETFGEGNVGDTVEVGDTVVVGETVGELVGDTLLPFLVPVQPQKIAARISTKISRTDIFFIN